MHLDSIFLSHLVFWPAYKIFSNFYVTLHFVTCFWRNPLKVVVYFIYILFHYIFNNPSAIKFWFWFIFHGFDTQPINSFSNAKYLETIFAYFSFKAVITSFKKLSAPNSVQVYKFYFLCTHLEGFRL